MALIKMKLKSYGKKLNNKQNNNNMNREEQLQLAEKRAFIKGFQQQGIKLGSPLDSINELLTRYGIDPRLGLGAAGMLGGGALGALTAGEGNRGKGALLGAGLGGGLGYGGGHLMNSQFGQSNSADALVKSLGHVGGQIGDGTRQVGNAAKQYTGQAINKGKELGGRGWNFAKEVGGNISNKAQQGAEWAGNQARQFGNTIGGIFNKK